MTKVFGFCLALLCCICEARTGYAQPGDASDVLDAYLAAYGQTLLYQGKQYVRTTSGTLGHQSHFTNAMTEGCTVRFDGVDFQDVPLMYDLELNELVTRHPERPVNLILSRAFVSRFTIGADTFVHVTDEGKGLVPGYYQHSSMRRPFRLMRSGARPRATCTATRTTACRARPLSWTSWK